MSFTKRKRPSPGAIRRSFVQPCTIPPLLFVESGLDALVGMVGGFFHPDVKETYHAIRGNTLFHDVKGSGEAAGELFGVEDHPGLRTTFKLGAVFDQIVWYMFLGDLTADGLYSWRTLPQRWSGCKHPATTEVQTLVNPRGAIYTDGTWNNGTEWDIANGPGKGNTGFLGGVTRPGRPWGVGAFVRFKTLNNEDIDVAARIADLTTGAVFDTQASSKRADGTYGSSHVWAHHNAYPTNHVIRMQFNSSQVTFDNEGFPTPEATGFAFGLDSY